MTDRPPLTPEALDTIEAGKAEAERIWPVDRKYDQTQLDATFTVQNVEAYSVSAFIAGVRFAVKREEPELRRLRTENERVHVAWKGAELDITKALDERDALQAMIDAGISVALTAERERIVAALTAGAKAWQAAAEISGGQREFGDAVRYQHFAIARGDAAREVAANPSRAALTGEATEPTKTQAEIDAAYWAGPGCEEDDRG